MITQKETCLGYFILHVIQVLKQESKLCKNFKSPTWFNHSITNTHIRVQLMIRIKFMNTMSTDTENHRM